MEREAVTERLRKHDEGRRSIRVLCVDDDPTMNELHQIVLCNQTDMECVGTLCTTNGLEQEILRTEADVLLLDMRMPDSDPLASIGAVRARFPAMVILVTSGLDDPAVVEETLALGADGFLLKTTDLQEMVDAVRRASRGEKPDASGRPRRGFWTRSRV